MNLYVRMHLEIKLADFMNFNYCYGEICTHGVTHVHTHTYIYSWYVCSIICGKCFSIPKY